MKRLTSEEINRIEERYTLPELLEILDVDFEDLRDSTLSDLYVDQGDEILELLEDG